MTTSTFALSSRFNPRPALASGTTPPCGHPCAVGVVSIRAPLSRAGRRKADFGILWYNGFNPRPALASGTTPMIRFTSRTMMFQSAPRSRERDDLHSPIAPLRPCRFNPRPALASGTTFVSTARISDECVSIRAPLSRAGRPRRPNARRAARRFQSAPRSRERDDSMSAKLPLGFIGFNPRPALASGTTCWCMLFVRFQRVSIRAPLSRAGRLRLTFEGEPQGVCRGWPRTRRELPDPSMRSHSVLCG